MLLYTIQTHNTYTHTYTQTHTPTHRHTHRHTYRHTHTQTDTHRHTHTDTHTHTHRALNINFTWSNFEVGKFIPLMLFCLTLFHIIIFIFLLEKTSSLTIYNGCGIKIYREKRGVLLTMIYVFPHENDVILSFFLPIYLFLFLLSVFPPPLSFFTSF